MNSKKLLKLQQINSRLQEYLWDKHLKYDDELKMLENERNQLKKTLAMEKQKNKEAFETYSRRISKLKSNLEAILISTPSFNPVKRKKLSNSKLRFSLLEEQGEKLKKETDRILNLCRTPPKRFVYDEFSEMSSMNENPVEEIIYEPIRIEKQRFKPRDMEENFSSGIEGVFNSPKISPRSKLPNLDLDKLEPKNDGVIEKSNENNDIIQSNNLKTNSSKESDNNTTDQDDIKDTYLDNLIKQTNQKQSQKSQNQTGPQSDTIAYDQNIKKTETKSQSKATNSESDDNIVFSDVDFNLEGNDPIWG